MRTRVPLLAALLAMPFAFAFAAPGPQPPVPFDAAVDRPSAAIGDKVVVTWSARLPEGSRVELEALVSPKLESPAGSQGGEDGLAVEYGTPSPEKVEKKGDGTVLWSRSVSFAPMVAGSWQLPGPHLAVVSPSGERTAARPRSVLLTVSSRLPSGEKKDEIAPRALRPPRIPPVPTWVWVSLAALALALCALGAWAFRKLRGRVSGDGAEAPAAPPVPPGTEYLASLDALSSRLPAPGEDPRPFYSELTFATKRYLERRLSQPVLEWTTGETVRRLRDAGVPIPREAGLAELLGAADQVKFARAAAARTDAERHLGRAREIHDRLEAALAPPPPVPSAQAGPPGAGPRAIPSPPHPSPAIRAAGGAS